MAIRTITKTSAFATVVMVPVFCSEGQSGSNRPTKGRCRHCLTSVVAFMVGISRESQIGATRAVYGGHVSDPV